MELKKAKDKGFLVLGRAGMDLYADPPGAETEHASSFSAALGGSAANIAAGIVRLGGKASLATAVSDDAVGRFTVNELKRYGIGTEHIKQALADDFASPWSVCRPPRANLQGVLTATVAMLVMQPSLGIMEVAPLPALGLNFTTYTLPIDRAATRAAAE